MDEFRRRKARARLREAQQALARGAPAVAEQACADALRLDPSPRAGWELWAESLGAQGKSIEAARVLARAVEHHADDPSLQLALAAAQANTGQYGAAERSLIELHARWPEQRPPLAHLARVLRDTRQFARLQALLEGALAGSFAGDVELDELLAACRRWRGLTPAVPVGREGLRAFLLARHGTILLGTGHDDGVDIPWYSTYLCSNYDVLATCARLLGVAAHLGWRWRAVAAVDAPAEVLAELLAGALGCSRVAASSAPDPATTLAVASFLAPGWEQAKAETAGPWAQRCAAHGNLFAFGALDYARHERPLPPLLGVAAGERVCLPWWRLGEARIGFSRFGLLADLPPEIDGRPVERIADDYRRSLAEFELGPGFAVALRELVAARSQLQPGLRERSDFARIPPRIPARDTSPPTPGALERGTLAELLRALGSIEARVAAGARLSDDELRSLESRFETTPEVRSRLSDLLYRVAPQRFTALLERLVARPEDEVPWGERDGLLHLYGCDPWARGAPAQLRRWLSIGSLSNRSEIVQSKYGLLMLADGPDFGAVFEQLLADEAPVVLGSLRWLHDNPRLHRHAAGLRALLSHDHPDVVFEALQCMRAAKLALPLATLEPLLQASSPSGESPHPRLISAAVEHLELLPAAQTRARLLTHLHGESLDGVWAATRSLTRGGTPSERASGAREVARLLHELVEAGEEGATRASRRILQALATVDDYELLAEVLAASETPARMKVVAAGLGATLLGCDDPRLLSFLRRFPDAFGLAPPPGYARFYLRHGDSELDSLAVRSACGASDPLVGYEATAVLAAWGEQSARAELERALDYPGTLGVAAFRARASVLPELDGSRLERARRGGGPWGDALWAVLRARTAEPDVEPAAEPDGEPAAKGWLSQLAEQLAAAPGRAREWAGFIEGRLRGQIPGKFVVGAQSADFAVLARLLPREFEALVERSLGGVPDRFAVDLLAWLGAHRPASARAWAERVADSPHWGLRRLARELLAGGVSS